MLVQGKHYRTIWLKEGEDRVLQVIDQRLLPHQFLIEDLNTVDEVIVAIKEMHVRGAGLIGATAGYGMYLATLEAADSGVFNESLDKMAGDLRSSRPTAVNLAWAVERQLKVIQQGSSNKDKIALALKTADEIADEDDIELVEAGEESSETTEDKEEAE